jgi:MATE family multidrug resistance protein
MIAGVLLNVGLNWILIYGNLGAPAMGLDGAGVATLLARVAVAAAIIVYMLLAPALKDGLPVNWLAIGLIAEMRRLLAIGLPTGGMHLAEVSGFAFGSLMMGWLGREPSPHINRDPARPRRS